MEIKMMNNLKQKLGKSIENRRDELTTMADKIFDLSEVSGEEYQSAELLCSYLEKEGFEVERGTGFPTAFRAEWRNGSGGPVIGILVRTLRFNTQKIPFFIFCIKFYKTIFIIISHD